MTYYSTRYATSQGERWTDVAYAFYNNASRTAELVEANPQYANRLVFEAGLELRIPILESTTAASLPPWKQVSS